MKWKEFIPNYPEFNVTEKIMKNIYFEAAKTEVESALKLKFCFQLQNIKNGKNELVRRSFLK